MDTENCKSSVEYDFAKHLLSAYKEYTDGINQKINEIIFTEEISVNKIRDIIDSLPDTPNAKLLKESVSLLYKNRCLTKKSIKAIAGDSDEFSVSYFSNGVLKILDAVGLIDSENMEWILKGPFNVLFWNLAVLNKNKVLTYKSLQSLNNKTTSERLSKCFTHLYMPQLIEESQPSEFITSCSDTFYDLGINPFAARLPQEALAMGMTDRSCSLGSERSLFASNILLAFIGKLVLKTRGTVRNIHQHYTRIEDNYDAIRNRLDRVETLLVEAIQAFEDYPKDELYFNKKNYETSSANGLSSWTTTLFGFFKSKGEKNFRNSNELFQEEHNCPNLVY